ncbi:hypothetical protein GQX74_011157 [Glossina fuscipes]|nr:hypothetical protein GQX74_011157 [Glossina fuscipes]
MAYSFDPSQPNPLLLRPLCDFYVNKWKFLLVKGKPDGGNSDSFHNTEEVCKTEISNNYDWDEDDDYILASISTQEILYRDVKINNNFPHTRKFPDFKKLAENGRSWEYFIENEWEEVKSKVSRDEVGKLNNPGSSLISESFQTANGKKISKSKESQISVRNIPREFQDNLLKTNYETELKDIKARMSIKTMESKFEKNAHSSAQIANKTGFQATFKIYKIMLARPPQLCETPNRNSRQTETATPELGEFVKNAVETSTPGVNRKLYEKAREQFVLKRVDRRHGGQTRMTDYVWYARKLGLAWAVKTTKGHTSDWQNLQLNTDSEDDEPFLGFELGKNQVTGPIEVWREEYCDPNRRQLSGE